MVKFKFFEDTCNTPRERTFVSPTSEPTYELVTGIKACCFTHLKFWKVFRERLFISCTMEIFWFKLAGFAYVATNIGKEKAVDLYSGSMPGLIGSKKKLIFSEHN